MQGLSRKAVPSFTRYASPDCAAQLTRDIAAALSPLDDDLVDKAPVGGSDSE